MYIIFYFLQFIIEKEQINGMDQAVREILRVIEKLYESYQEKSNVMSEDKRQKMGATIDKQEKKFMEDLSRLEPKIANIITDMDKSEAMKKPELRDSPRLMKQCLQDVQAIIKKKNLLFKVNKHLEQLMVNTNQQLEIIKKDLKIAGETKFLCCGTDGITKFKSTMEKFKLSSQQWGLLARLQPKDSVQTFISPKFTASQYNFIKQILKNHWPQDTVKVEVKEKIVQKIINTGKPSILTLANQYIYGINRQQNPFYGLKIYHEEADKNNFAAASYLGQVYQEGILLPQDSRKANKYYQKAMSGKENYGIYRFAIALIKGQLKQGGVNKEDLESGYKYLTQIAYSDSNPCPEALIQLGELFQKSKFDSDKQGLFKVAIDLKKAIDFYQRARSMHVPRAANNLGVLYINNKYLSQSNPNTKINSEENAFDNIQKGVKYLEQACKEGFPQAFYNLGCVYQNGITGRKYPQEALMNYYKGGLKGDLQSRLKFAYQLMNQTSIMKQQYEDHYKVAYRWLDRIIHRIDIVQENSPANSQIRMQHSPSQKAQALFYMGLMHEYGFGVDKSPKKAFNYLSQASDLGYSAAKNKVGDCYFSGYGVREDRRLAIGCYLDAAELKNSDAMVNLGTIYLNGIPNMIQRNYNEAYKYFVKAMDQQNSNAMIHLSYMYKNGLGLESDRQMAKKLLEESAANKNPTALYMLKQMGGQYDQKLLFNNLDNDFFTTPRKINFKEIVPYVNQVKL